MSTELNEKETLAKITNHLISKLPENEKLVSSNFENVNMLNGRISLPILYTVSHTAKTGRVTRKKKTIHLYPRYCPFTGKKFES